MTSLLPKRGQVSLISFEVVRELTPEDLSRLPQIPSTGPPPLQTLKAIHRRQAQLIATGKSAVEVAEIVGCTPTRIYQLLKDPTFAELVSYYLDQQDTLSIEDAQRFQEKWRLAGEMALDEMNERLSDDNQRAKIPIGELRNIAKDSSDRTVAPPKAIQGQVSAPAQVTLNFGTELKKPKDVTPDTKVIDNE